MCQVHNMLSSLAIPIILLLLGGFHPRHMHYGVGGWTEAPPAKKGPSYSILEATAPRIENTMLM